MMAIQYRFFVTALASLVLVACGDRSGGNGVAEKPGEYVVVYTSVDEQQMLPVYRAFTSDSGIRIQQVSADDAALLQWILDKRRTPVADIYLAAGASRLWRATDADVFRPTHVDALREAIPGHLRDPDNQWFGLAVSANVIVFNTGLAGAAAPGTYESLADEAWKGRICLTTSIRVENIGFVASLIERHGTRAAELLVRQLIANLALPVFDDTDPLLAAVESGQCHAGIAPLDVAAAYLSANAGTKLGVLTPAATNGGTQVDILAAGVTRHSGNPAGAARFLTWLATGDAQRILAESRAALPAVPGAEVPAQLASWRDLSQSATGVFRLGRLSQEAIDLAERARYN
jgi:iron(III) transport system substrate-binding protein